MVQIYNKNTDKLENAKKELCPRCKGFGQLCTEEKKCYLCNGKGELWISKLGTSWTRAFHRSLDDSIFY